MRIPCPTCGQRDRREFSCFGHASWLDRPAPDAPSEAWDAYLHLRENPCGPTRDLWYHDACGTWAVVSRDTASHAVARAEAVGEFQRARRQGT